MREKVSYLSALFLVMACQPIEAQGTSVDLGYVYSSQTVYHAARSTLMDPWDQFIEESKSLLQLRNHRTSPLYYMIIRQDAVPTRVVHPKSWSERYAKVTTEYIFWGNDNYRMLSPFSFADEVITSSLQAQPVWILLLATSKDKMIFARDTFIKQGIQAILDLVDNTIFAVVMKPKKLEVAEPLYLSVTPGEGLTSATIFLRIGSAYHAEQEIYHAKPTVTTL